MFRGTTFTRMPAPEIDGAALPGSPPPIPHDLQMRSNCLACHAGPAAVREVRIPGADGDLTAMPGHAPLISTVRPGIIEVHEDGKVTDRIFVAGPSDTQVPLSAVVRSERALSPLSVYVFASVMGLLWLSTVPPTNATVAQIFGVAHLSMLGGFVFFSHQIGSFMGVWLGGYLYDRTGSYDVVWYIAIALGIFAALVNLPVKEAAIQRGAPQAA